MGRKRAREQREQQRKKKKTDRQTDNIERKNCELACLVAMRWYSSTVMVTATLLKKKVLSRTLKGSSAVSIEEPFLVPGRTFFGSMKNTFHRGFYMESKRVLPGTKKGYPMGKAEEPLRNIFLYECSGAVVEV